MIECRNCLTEFQLDESTASRRRIVCPQCRATLPIPDPRPTNSKEVILLVHGIRTWAEWQPMVKRLLEAPNREVWPVRFGRFNLFCFLVPGFAWLPIRKVENEYRRAVHNNPNADISVIAHSFGTYAVGRILADRTDVDLRSVILCGSILKPSYRWDRVCHRISSEIINDYSDRDIWPALARAMSWRYGPSGTYGFETGEITNRPHRFGHSDYFNEPFVRKYWLPWFDKAAIVQGEEPRPQGFHRTILAAR